MLELLDYELEGVKQWLHIKNDGAFTDIGDGWKFYKEQFEKHLKGRDVAVQAGGYCGIFPRCMSQMFRLVYTFEPDPLNFHCLVHNNPILNVIKMQAALGSKHEMIAMNYQSETNAGMKNVVQSEKASIPTLRVDDLNLSHCDLIMLDIEGYEINALHGADETITKFKPLISVEDTNGMIEYFLFERGYKPLAAVFRDTIYGV